jgi:hypothetical protein
MARSTLPGRRAFSARIRPQVVVVNNGPRKGLGATDTRVQPSRRGQAVRALEENSYLRLAKLPGIEGIWRGISRSSTQPAHNTTPDMIANVEETAECQGHEITRGRCRRQGHHHGRNGFSKSYMARKLKGRAASLDCVSRCDVTGDENSRAFARITARAYCACRRTCSAASFRGAAILPSSRRLPAIPCDAGRWVGGIRVICCV